MAPQTKPTKNKHRALAHITAAILAALAITSAPGCKSATKPAPSVAKKPAPSLVAFVKTDAAYGEASAWAAGVDGSGARELFRFETNDASATSAAPVRFVYASAAGNIYAASGRKVISYSLLNKNSAELAPLATTADGARHLWLSRDEKALLALCAPTRAEGANTAPEYIMLDTKTGAQKKISPADKDWDRFDFYNKIDYCYVDCEGKTYKSRTGASFKLEAVKGIGAGHWPVLSLKLKNGKTVKATDGAKRVLAARWTPSGAALIFIAADKCAASTCEGILRFVNASTGETVALSKSTTPPETVFNISTKHDIIYYDESPTQNITAPGVYLFDFVSKPKQIDPTGKRIVLLEAK